MTVLTVTVLTDGSPIFCPKQNEGFKSIDGSTRSTESLLQSCVSVRQLSLNFPSAFRQLSVRFRQIIFCSNLDLSEVPQIMLEPFREPYNFRESYNFTEFCYFRERCLLGSRAILESPVISESRKISESLAISESRVFEKHNIIEA